MSVKRLFNSFHANPYLLWALVLINLGGTVFGVYYYLDQIARTPFYMTPFVPDSPTATFLFALALFLIYVKRENPLITNFAFIGLIKVGIWTLFTMILYKHFFFSPDNLMYYSVLFVLHAGMIVEAFVIKDKISFKPIYWAPIILFYLIGDLLDYYIGLVPTPVGTLTPNFLPILTIESIAVTLLIAIYFYKGK